ncbi:MAG: inner membrane CreD family protein [Bacteroidaceae bacterium]|nr:inner membrane CreD family protein [Bacteroidaceae bacterium]
MEKNVKSNAKRTAIKISLLATVSLLLLIPLAMIEGVIEDREETKNAVIEEVANSYAMQQFVSAPLLTSFVVEEKLVDKKTDASGKQKYLMNYDKECSQVDYKADVVTDMLHRSVYDVIVYNSHIKIMGGFMITDKEMRARNIDFSFKVSDPKGFSNPSQLTFGGQTFNLSRRSDYFIAEVTLPASAKVGEMIDFAFSFDLKGTESLFFYPSGDGNTTLSINSSHPHPSFQGTLLPDHREVKNDGFVATWIVSNFNSFSHDNMGVKFVDPANPYQQSMRSAKYGMLIIVLVFVAGLFVEFLTRKEICTIQYAVIGLSLVLFYSLLVAFSEFIAFGIAYVAAASMTTGALIFYFRAILKNRSAYMLGAFVALVYAMNYMLLQMETYALLAGSLVLFLLLCVVMFLTANINNKKELGKMNNYETIE